MEGWVRGQWVKVLCPKVIPSHSQCSILKLCVWTAIYQNFLKKGSPLTEFWAVKCLMRLGFHKVVFRHIDNITTMTFSGDFISHLGIKASQIFQLDWARTEQTDLGFCLRLWLGLWLYFTLTSGLFITSWLLVCFCPNILFCNLSSILILPTFKYCIAIKNREENDPVGFRILQQLFHGIGVSVHLFSSQRHINHFLM